MSSMPGAGHLIAVLAFARAFAQAGDEVLVAVREPGIGMVRAAGFEAWPLDGAASPARDAVFARARRLAFDQANALVVREIFGPFDGRAALPGIRAAIGAWHRDVVVIDITECAAPIAARWGTRSTPPTWARCRPASTSSPGCR